MLLIVNLVEKWPNFYDYQFWKRVEYNDPAHASSIKTFTQNWDSIAPSVGTLLAFLETMT